MIFSLLFTALFIAVIGVGVFFTARNFMRGGSRKVAPISVILAVVGLIGIVTVPGSFHTVETGQVAVVKHLGDAQKIREPGTYFDFCLTEKYEYYDAKVQNLEIQTSAYSADAQTMDITMTVQYQIRKENAIDIAKHYGTVETLANRIQSIATEKAKAYLSGSSAMDIIKDRSKISPDIENIIMEAVNENYYVDVVTVVLTNIDFSEAFEKIVEDKMIAEQEQKKAEYEKQTAITNAEKELEVSKLEAQAKLERAKADAEAQVEIAKAEAEATKLKSIEIARALGFEIIETPVTDGEVTLIEYEISFEGKTAEEIKLITDYLKYANYLETWDGKLPTVVTGDSATLMIPAPDGSSSANP